ncbi:MAG: toll/interleukin-1 receptor domain-containing protein [Acidobacteriota bacterium]|nr:toll/interleukin-1 receptor domain-containing protein [Acidobacteriota bacterium]
MQYDVFISHAHEDKDSVARPLTAKLRESGVKVWLDEFELKLGDSLRRSIERGLSQSKFGIVILSRNFFRKEWTQRELDVLLTKEETARKVILPIWHEITKEEVVRFSPLLADKLAASTEKGLDYVAQQILSVVKAEIPLESAVADLNAPVVRTQPKPETAPVPDEKSAKPKISFTGCFVILAILVGIAFSFSAIVTFYPGGLNANRIDADGRRAANAILTNPNPDKTPTLTESEKEVIENPKEVVLEGCRFSASGSGSTYISCKVFNGFRDRIIVRIEIEIKLDTPIGPQILHPSLTAALEAMPLRSTDFSTNLLFPHEKLSLNSKKNIKVLVKPITPVR